MTVLMHACATGNHDRVRQCLLSVGSDSRALQLELTAVDDWAGSTPLHWAAFSGNVLVVTALLEVGAQVRVPTQLRTQSLLSSQLLISPPAGAR